MTVPDMTSGRYVQTQVLQEEGAPLPLDAEEAGASREPESAKALPVPQVPQPHSHSQNNPASSNRIVYTTTWSTRRGQGGGGGIGVDALRSGDDGERAAETTSGGERGGSPSPRARKPWWAGAGAGAAGPGASVGGEKNASRF